MIRLGPLALLPLLAVLTPTVRAQVDCPAFTGGFEAQDIYGQAFASLVHDDGSGSALYVGGSFVGAGSALGLNVARWNGTNWSTLDDGVDGGVASLVSFDDGLGLELIAGGSFQNASGVAASRIAAWNGASWRPLGGGLNGDVDELFVWDDGSGPALYVGGSFTQAGGMDARGIARWKNGAWSALGTGVTLSTSAGRVHALTSFDFGAGSRLVAGGRFTGAGGTLADSIAAWDGSVWSAVGAGVSNLCCTGGVLALATFDEGQGPRLFAAGSEGSATFHPYQPLLRWDGGAWTAVTFVSATWDFATINALSVYDDGSGPALYCAGIFQQVPGIGLTNYARWDGTTWSLGAPALGWYAFTIARWDDGQGGGTKTYLGGGADLTSTAGPKRFGRLDPGGWSALEPAHDAVDAVPTRSIVHDDGTGSKLYVGGFANAMTQAGGVTIHGAAAWDGTAWSAAGNLADPIRVLASLDIAGQRELYAGVNAITTSMQLVRRWDGAQWIPLPGNFAIAGERYVAAFALFDAGNGPELIAGGRFTTIDGASRNRIARFDGTSWHPLGDGLDDNVSALAVVDAGDGPSLYAGGLFNSAIGVPGTSKIARWDGAQWHAVGGGITGGPFPVRVAALQAFDDGTGMALYAAGRFASAGGQPAASIARWRAGSWSPLGSGASGDVLDLDVYDAGDGSGARLVAGGSFVAIGGAPAHSVAAWTGSSWQTFQSGGHEGVDSGVSSLTVGPIGSDVGSSLFLTGGFRRAGDHPSVHVARFAGCDRPGEIACSGDGSGATCPCANPGVAGGGCTNSTGRSASLRASGSPGITADTLVLRGANMTPSSTCLYFQGTTLTAGGAGLMFGDGLRCAGGSVIRLGVAVNVAGESSFPALGGTALSTLGGVTSEGTRVYQCWYRDAAAYCTSATFNLTNALVVDWRP